MAKIKKAANGTTTAETTKKPTPSIQEIKKSFKIAIDDSNKRVRRGKNDLTTGDVHADNEKTTPMNRFGAKMSNALERLINPKGFKKTKDPDKVLSALSKNKNGGSMKKKMKNGGSLSGLKASNKRVGPVDPKGAFTKVQKKTLAGAKGKASLTKDKQLGATKMAKCGTKMSKK